MFLIKEIIEKGGGGLMSHLLSVLVRGISAYKLNCNSFLLLGSLGMLEHHSQAKYEFLYRGDDIRHRICTLAGGAKQTGK
jgi:hypothetical protein